jgi:hypothetical protein
VGARLWALEQRTASAAAAAIGRGSQDVVAGTTVPMVGIGFEVHMRRAEGSDDWVPVGTVAALRGAKPETLRTGEVEAHWAPATNTVVREVHTAKVQHIAVAGATIGVVPARPEVCIAAGVGVVAAPRRDSAEPATECSHWRCYIRYCNSNWPVDRADSRQAEGNANAGARPVPSIDCRTT